MAESCGETLNTEYLPNKYPTRRPASTGLFSPNYKYFDQLLQTVKNKTTVLNLVFKELLQASIPPLISIVYAKGYHDFPLKNFCLSVENFRRGTLLCFRKFLVSKNVRGRGRGRVSRFSVKILSHSTESFRKGTLLCFRNFRVAKNFMPKWGISRFSTENFLSHSAEKCRGTLLCCVSENFRYRKILCLRGLFHEFCRIFFISVPKFS